MSHFWLVQCDTAAQVPAHIQLVLGRSFGLLLRILPDPIELAVGAFLGLVDTSVVY
jgi:hypothetical protein